MTSSQARLVVEQLGGSTRAVRAAAGAPQRWVVPPRAAADGTLEVTHQLMGDGVFGGDVHRTTIVARPGTRLLIRALAATPLRGTRPSMAAARLHVAAGATVLYLPGTLVPHRDADFRSVTDFEVAAGGRLLAASILVPGRTAMGEADLFHRLQIRTRARVADELALAEDVVIRSGPLSAFGAAGASLTILALGAWAPGCPDWWKQFGDLAGVTGGASALRTGGSCYRAVCQTLGDALEMVSRVVAATGEDRRHPDSWSPGNTLETHSFLVGNAEVTLL